MYRKSLLSFRKCRAFQPMWGIFNSPGSHLSKMFVIEGDSVTRGEVIGEVGNTGVSSGAHLHYEVRYRNNTVNPIHYFNKDMTPEAYIDLMEQLSENK